MVLLSSVIITNFPSVDVVLTTEPNVTEPSPSSKTPLSSVVVTLVENEELDSVMEPLIPPLKLEDISFSRYYTTIFYIRRLPLSGSELCGFPI